MTDKEEFIKLLKKFNIPYYTKNNKDYYQEYCNGCENPILIIVDDKRVQGYMDFHCIIEFDGNDKFKEIGIWE